MSCYFIAIKSLRVSTENLIRRTYFMGQKAKGATSFKFIDLAASQLAWTVTHISTSRGLLIILDTDRNVQDLEGNVV